MRAGPSASAAAAKAALAVAVAAWSPSASAAAPATVAVTRTDAAKDCPDAAALARGVSHAAGRASDATLTTADDAGGADYAVSFTADARGYAASIDVGTARGGGERRLTDAGATCDALGDAVTLTLAVLLDASNARATAASPPPAPPPPPTTSTSTAESASPTANGGGGASSRLGVVVDAGASALSGVVRAWAPALFLAASLEPPGVFAVGVEGTFVPRQDLALGPGTVGVTFFGGALLVCATPLGKKNGLRAGACVFPEVGAITADGRGYTSGGSATRPWIAGGGELLLRGVIAGPVGFRVHAGAAVPVRREAFGIDRVGIAYDPAAVAVFAGAGLSANLR